MVGYKNGNTLFFAIVFSTPSLHSRHDNRQQQFFPTSFAKKFTWKETNWKHVEEQVVKRTRTNRPKQRSNGQKNIQEYKQREKERKKIPNYDILSPDLKKNSRKVEKNT